jgi:hypothetical protein
MKKIKHKIKDITITSRGWNTGQNTIITDVKCIMSDSDYISNVIPSFVFSKPESNYFFHSQQTAVPNMPEIKAQAQCEQSDVGKSGDTLEQDFAVAILWLSNALNLVNDDWILIDE